MSTYGLERVFAPRTLALVGGSSRPSSLGAKILQNLLRGGFGGDIAVVNPKYGLIDGKNTYPDLASVPFVPDLIVITAPASAVPGIVAEAGRLRPRADNCGGRVAAGADRIGRDCPG